MDTNRKMVRTNECKDLSVLKSEFPEHERRPLNITLLITSAKKLEYSYLSNLLSTYGKLQKLVIDESSLNAKIKFFSIGSAFRVFFKFQHIQAYHDFLKEKNSELRFEDKELHRIVTQGKEKTQKIKLVIQEKEEVKVAQLDKKEEEVKMVEEEIVEKTAGDKKETEERPKGAMVEEKQEDAEEPTPIIKETAEDQNSSSNIVLESSEAK